MADSRRYALGNQLDIEQLLLEAQHRWLRPAEICEILRNYQKFCIAPEPANMPSSGSLFLFDRKVLRYFRKDGHNWRKKKDGKTVKEAHERLKAGSIDVLHCYYAHGEENENFQRRSYWMLEDDLSHIVLVHYREVKGNRTNFNRIKETEEAIPCSQETEDILPNSEIDSSGASNFHLNNYRVPSQTTDTTSLNSVQASDYEDTESAYNHQASSGLHCFLESQQSMVEKINAGLANPYFDASSSRDFQGKLSAISRVDFVSLTLADKVKDSNNPESKHLDFALWDDILGNGTSGGEAVPLQPSFPETQPDTIGVLSKQENQILGQLFTSNLEIQEFGSHLQVQEEWQTSESKLPLDRVVQTELASEVTSKFHEDVIRANLLNSLEPCFADNDNLQNHPIQNNLQVQLSNAEHEDYLKSDRENKMANYSFAIKPPLLDGSLSEEGLKKLDSFNRWMSKELGDVNESHMQSSSGAYWDSVASESRVDGSSISSQVHLDNYILGPSLSQDQLFSIIDFSPNWAYEGSEVKVLITGRFLKSQQEAEICKWSCMFGELEVPAEVIADGVLRCHTPVHKAARLPFYVTNSNRLACSEVRAQIQEPLASFRLSVSVFLSMASTFVTVPKPFLYKPNAPSLSYNQRLLGLRRNSLRINAISKKWEPAKVVPQADRVLIRLEQLPEKSAGGVLLPNAAVKFERYLIGEILTVGAEVGEVEAGKKVLFSDINAYEVDLGTDAKHCFCKSSDLLAVVE